MIFSTRSADEKPKRFPASRELKEKEDILTEDTIPRIPPAK
jgi:hypothetical protein